MAAFQYLATMPGYTSPSFAPSADMIEMKNNLLTDAEINTPIHPPLKEHRQTFIILHGRGSSTEEIAPALLSSTASKNEALQSAFPHAKIIFPTATRKPTLHLQRSPNRKLQFIAYTSMAWQLVSPKLPFGTGKAFCSGIVCMLLLYA
jgi:hypothetical protein